MNVGSCLNVRFHRVTGCKPDMVIYSWPLIPEHGRLKPVQSQPMLYREKLSRKIREAGKKKRMEKVKEKTEQRGKEKEESKERRSEGQQRLEHVKLWHATPMSTRSWLCLLQ